MVYDRFWVTCGVKMMSLRYGWGWQPPQTASCINLRHIQCVWVHQCAVHEHKAVASNSYTHTTWLIFWGLGHLWSQKDVITSWLRLTAASNWFLHPHKAYTMCLSKLICCPWAYSSNLKQLYLHYLAHIFGLGHLWSQHDVITSWMSLKATSNCFLCIHIRHMQSVWSHWFAVHGHTTLASNSYSHNLCLIFWGLGHLWSQKDVITLSLWQTATSNCFLHPYWIYTKCLSTLICCPWAYGSSL